LSRYTLELFVHVSGAIGLFASVGAWLFGMAALRRAERVEQVGPIARLMGVSGNIAVASVVLLGTAGLDMALTVWGWHTAWIDVATSGVVLLGAFGAFIIDPRVRAIAKQAHAIPDGQLPAPLWARIHDPVLLIGLYTYVVTLFGIVFLMTVKPPLIGSLLASAGAAALGLLVGLLFWRVDRVRTLERGPALRVPQR
jgi:hypothetical protein